jgi:DNA (cytosine-5)-methyltransferase 1
VVTGEGGSSPSRFKHVVKVNGHMRRLTPVELERLNLFPDNHTAGIPDSRRAFLMGNALVVGVVRKIAEKLARLVKSRQATAISVPGPSPRERVAA